MMISPLQPVAVVASASHHRLNPTGGDSMLAVLIALAIGIVIGWNWPQPPWARDIQARIVQTFQSLTNQGPK
jgi:hypothetical protein